MLPNVPVSRVVSDGETVFIHAESPSQSLDFLPKTGILPYFQGDFQELLRILSIALFFGLVACSKPQTPKAPTHTSKPQKSELPIPSELAMQAF